MEKDIGVDQSFFSIRIDRMTATNAKALNPNPQQ